MPFEICIYSPQKRMVKKVDMAVLPGIEGNFGVLAGHAPFITAVKSGKIKVVGEGFVEYYNIGFGLVEVLPERTVLITDIFSEEKDKSGA